jgi:hypothetical protein
VTSSRLEILSCAHFAATPDTGSSKKFIRSIPGLPVPSKQVEAQGDADQGKEVEFHLEPELKLDHRKVDEKRLVVDKIAEPEADVVRKQVPYHVVRAGNEREKRAEIGADKNADDHNQDKSPDIPIFKADGHTTFLFVPAGGLRGA